MPYVSLKIDGDNAKQAVGDVLEQLARDVAEPLGKSVASVMASFESAEIMMAMESGPAAFLEVKSIGGLDNAVNTEITRRICATLEARLGIPPDRVYINFIDIARSDWGWKGATFER